MALKMIAEGGEKYFEEALALIQKQRLFKQAMALYEHDEELHTQVKRAFGDYLQQRGYVQEAGFLYMSSDEPEDLEKSLNAFKKCGNTDMCLSIAYKLGCDQEQVVLLTKDLIEVLVTAQRYKDAADLLCTIEDYDVAQAVEYYAKANAFMAAIREAMKE
jgi:hypothetical protein